MAAAAAAAAPGDDEGDDDDEQEVAGSRREQLENRAIVLSQHYTKSASIICKCSRGSSSQNIFFSFLNTVFQSPKTSTARFRANKKTVDPNKVALRFRTEFHIQNHDF